MKKTIKTLAVAGVLSAISSLCLGAIQLTPEGVINIYGTATTLGMTISQNGNVGVGVINPKTKLEVAGVVSANSVNLSGTLNVSGLTTLASASVNGTLSVNTLVLLNESLNGVLTVNGITTVNTFTASNTTINGTLHVLNLATLSALTVNGSISANNLFLPSTTASNGQIWLGPTQIQTFGSDAGNGNFFVGPSVGNKTMTGQNNVGIGYQVLKSNSSGGNNNAFGISALNKNDSGWDNNAFGANALQENVDGGQNNAFGNSALIFNISGHQNNAFGDAALNLNTTGQNNNGFGALTLAQNLKGYQNNAFGPYALDQLGNDGIAEGAQNDWEYSDNIAIGYTAGGGDNSGPGLRRGAGNVFIGRASGERIEHGDYNVMIGHDAGPTAQQDMSNRLYINSSQSDTPLIYGEFDNQKLTFGSNVDINDGSGAVNIRGTTGPDRGFRVANEGGTNSFRMFVDSDNGYLTRGGDIYSGISVSPAGNIGIQTGITPNTVLHVKVGQDNTGVFNRDAELKDGLLIESDPVGADNSDAMISFWAKDSPSAGAGRYGTGRIRSGWELANAGNFEESYIALESHAIGGDPAWDTTMIVKGGSIGIGTGNVGVSAGTGAKLHVADGYIRISNAEGNGEELRLGSAFGNPGVWNDTPAGTHDLFLGNENPNDIRFLTEADTAKERMRITSVGNVGIGTDVPSTTLEVSGNISANALVVSGTLTANKLSLANASLSGGLTVNGVTSVNYLTASNSTVNGTLRVTGLTTMASLSVNGTISANNFMGGNVSLNGNVTGNNFEVLGIIDVTGLATMTNLSVNNTVSSNRFIGGSISVNGTISASSLALSGRGTMSSLTVNGAVSLNSLYVANGSVGIGVATPISKLQVAGNISLTAAGVSVSAVGTELVMESVGDTYGPVRLRMQNRNGANGAVFEQGAIGNGAEGLVDFVFKPNYNSIVSQRNIRIENRVGSIFVAQPEMQFGIAANPTFVVADSYSSFRNGNVGIGIAQATQKLQVVGTVLATTFSGSGAGLTNIAISRNEVYSAATATNTLAAGTVVMTSMTLTPGAGTYLVMFNSSADHSVANTLITISIYANGVQVANSIRTFQVPLTGSKASIATTGFATVAAAQAIDIRWSTAADTASVYNRGLYLLRVQ